MKTTNTILVTGGAGFIGSNFVLEWLSRYDRPVINLDALTYSGNMHNLDSVAHDQRYIFIKGDIGEQSLVKNLLEKYRPNAIINFAAETHVDRSILSPDAFIQTNIVGTYRLLESTLYYWKRLDTADKKQFRFLHVSTDEVYGSLNPGDPLFTEQKQYEPNSPYSASKAAADHLVRAYHHTYGLPVLTTNCSNNYGPFQFPEKLIPLVIINAIGSRPLPVYGDGLHIRDWLYVHDHCNGIMKVLSGGRVGETYNIGGGNEMTNIDIVRNICRILDELLPSAEGKYERLITYVADRPGHDRRYAIDTKKINAELDWSPVENFDSGLRKTVSWYIDNPQWILSVTSGAYRSWITENYQHRNGRPD